MLVEITLPRNKIMYRQLEKDKCLESFLNKILSRKNKCATHVILSYQQKCDEPMHEVLVYLSTNIDFQ